LNKLAALSGAFTTNARWTLFGTEGLPITDTRVQFKRFLFLPCDIIQALCSYRCSCLHRCCLPTPAFPDSQAGVMNRRSARVGKAQTGATIFAQAQCTLKPTSGLIRSFFARFILHRHYSVPCDMYRQMLRELSQISFQMKDPAGPPWHFPLPYTGPLGIKFALKYDSKLRTLSHTNFRLIVSNAESALVAWSTSRTLLQCVNL